MPQSTCQCGAELEIPSGAPKAFKCASCGAKVEPVTGAQPISEKTQFTAAMIIRRGPQNKGRIYLLGGDGPIEIGKRSLRHITLKGALKVSRHHCDMVNSGGTWVITDRGSSHGLVVRSKKVDTRALENGDTLWIGEYKIHFQLLDGQGGGYDEDDADASSGMTGESQEDAAEDSSEMTMSFSEAPAAAEPPERDMDLMREPGAQNFSPPPFESPHPPANVEAPPLPIESAPGNEPEEEAPKPVANRNVGAQCPQCEGPMQAKAVLCTNCGFDLSRGKRMSEAAAKKSTGDVLGQEPEGQMAVVSSGFRMGQLVVPVMLLCFGLILHVIAGRLAINYHEWAGSLGNVFGFAIVQALIGVTLSILSCLIAATLMSVSIGHVQLAALRIAAVVMLPAAVQTAISSLFYESPMVADIVSFCLLTACYVGLLVWMFDLTTVEALILAVLIGVINVWGVAMFIADFPAWITGGSGAPSLDSVAPVGAEAGGGV